MRGFNIGDVLRLKSGGPDMTINYIADDGDVQCYWFTGSKREEAFFNSQAVEALGAVAVLVNVGQAALCVDCPDER